MIDPPPDRPIEVRRSPIAGRGLFTTRAVVAGEVLDVSPVLVIPADQRRHLDRTALSGHYWDWDGDAAVALGLISFTNHAELPNAYWERDDDGPSLVLVAARDLGPGEEVLAHYLADADPDGDDQLWFEPRSAGEPG